MTYAGYTDNAASALHADPDLDAKLNQAFGPIDKAAILRREPKVINSLMDSGTVDAVPLAPRGSIAKVEALPTARGHETTVWAEAGRSVTVTRLATEDPEAAPEYLVKAYDRDHTRELECYRSHIDRARVPLDRTVTGFTYAYVVQLAGALHGRTW
jgi:hypothetical protein